jgi:hypothetical protein
VFVVSEQKLQGVRNILGEMQVPVEILGNVACPLQGHGWNMLALNCLPLTETKVMKEKTTRVRA